MESKVVRLMDLNKCDPNEKAEIVLILGRKGMVLSSKEIEDSGHNYSVG